MTIRDQTIDVDVEAELRDFDWHRARWTSDKLLAASPFRDDRTPSFFVRLEATDDHNAGVWHDSGAYDEAWSKGNFAQLLAYLRNESYEEAEDYLLATYGVISTGGVLKLRAPKLKLSRKRQALKDSILAKYSTEPSEYLLQRGITADVQRQMGVLDGGNHIVIPWRGADGKLLAIKYRSKRGKQFWYERGGASLRDLLWGLDAIYRERARTVVLCEAEIDAMSWRVAGYAAVANGGVAFNSAKRDLLVRSPIEELIIATDNDAAGEKLRAEVERAMVGYVRVRQAYVPAAVKDANEALVRGGRQTLHEAICNSEYVNLRTLSRR
ncbi:toprim domain-containing protein [Bacillus sp. JJ722]|uniref:toprim domain-containing protein n=1 Tax=Bacillus sp. JJ722 TaxID=3122973 RepID=UPI002FFFC137